MCKQGVLDDVEGLRWHVRVRGEGVDLVRIERSFGVVVLGGGGEAVRGCGLSLTCKHNNSPNLSVYILTGA